MAKSFNVQGSITLPFGKLMLPKLRGNDMLPSKSQPDYGWLLLFISEKIVPQMCLKELGGGDACGRISDPTLD